MLCYKDDELYFQQIALSHLVKQHGTPIYVYSLSVIQERLQKFIQAFDHQISVHFAMKCNANQKILQQMQKAQIGVDVVSQGEIKEAFAVGFQPSDVIFSGVAKTIKELTFAIENNIKQINVESPQELERIGILTEKLGKTACVAFRYNPDVNPVTHPYITTGLRENKFGMDSSFLPEIESILKKYQRLILRGVTIHIGSQVLDISVIQEAIEKTIPIYKYFESLGFPIESFDVGGGLGIPYQKEQQTPNIDHYGQMILGLLKPLSCEIICEPGRILMAPAGILLTEVQYIKSTSFKNFAMVDTGMHHLLRPALYDAHHEIWPLKQKKGLGKVYDVVGPICESADVIGKSRLLKELKQGDLLAILDVGAYGYIMANKYNAHPFPEEIFIP